VRVVVVLDDVEKLAAMLILRTDFEGGRIYTRIFNDTRTHDTYFYATDSVTVAIVFSLFGFRLNCITSAIYTEALWSRYHDTLLLIA